MARTFLRDSRRRRGRGRWVCLDVDERVRRDPPYGLDVLYGTELSLPDECGGLDDARITHLVPLALRHACAPGRPKIPRRKLGRYVVLSPSPGPGRLPRIDIRVYTQLPRTSGLPGHG
jgi:hypothetical protein